MARLMTSGASALDRSRLDNQVRDLIAERMASGVYKPGDALPSEVALAGELGVSRVTLRQALRTLEEDGALIKRQGIGTFVAEPLPALQCVLDRNLGVTEMIQRSGLEPGTSVHWVTEPYVEEEVSQLLQRSSDGLVALDRVRTANGRPIVRTTDVVSKEFAGAIRELEGQNVSLYAILDNHGVSIRRGAATLVPTKADQDSASFLDLPPGSMLLMLEQLDFDEADQPVMFSRELWVRRAITFTVDRHR